MASSAPKPSQRTLRRHNSRQHLISAWSLAALLLCCGGISAQRGGAHAPTNPFFYQSLGSGVLSSIFGGSGGEPLHAAYSPLPSTPAGGSNSILGSAFGAGAFLPRLFSSFVRVVPVSCSTGLATFGDGTCLDHEACASAGGISTSDCAMGFGTCCVLRETCGETASDFVHYFTNPSFPNTDLAVPGGSCSLTVDTCEKNICQIKIEFLDVSIVGPDARNGACNIDNISILGNGANPASVPTFCGRLANKHIYVNVEKNCQPTMINVDINVAQLASRRYNIKVTQIPCGSAEMAPPGCLEYHNGTSGTVSTFNYHQLIKDDLMAGQNYAVCVASKPGYCSISWRQTRGTQFSLPAKSDCNGSHQCCQQSYVLIPGATCPGMAFDSKCPVKDPRFCGNTFLPNSGPSEVISWHQPYTLFTYIPQPLPRDTALEGFSLDYTLNKCQ